MNEWHDAQEWHDRDGEQSEPETDDGLDVGAHHRHQADHEDDLPGEIGQRGPRIGPPGRW